jgi:hypothetical protein
MTDTIFNDEDYRGVGVASIWNGWYNSTVDGKVQMYQRYVTHIILTHILIQQIQ